MNVLEKLFVIISQFAENSKLEKMVVINVKVKTLDSRNHDFTVEEEVRMSYLSELNN